MVCYIDFFFNCMFTVLGCITHHNNCTVFFLCRAFLCLSLRPSMLPQMEQLTVNSFMRFVHCFWGAHFIYTQYKSSQNYHYGFARFYLLQNITELICHILHPFFIALCQQRVSSGRTAFTLLSVSFAFVITPAHSVR